MTFQKIISWNVFTKDVFGLKIASGKHDLIKSHFQIKHIIYKISLYIFSQGIPS